IPPAAFVICTSSMALIDDNKVKEVFWVISKIGSAVGTGHKCLKNGKEDISVFRDSSFFPYFIRSYAHQGIFLKSIKGIKCLICQYISICQEKYPGTAMGISP